MIITGIDEQLDALLSYHKRIAESLDELLPLVRKIAAALEPQSKPKQLTWDLSDPNYTRLKELSDKPQPE